MTSTLDRMMAEEKRRWLRSRGSAGGTLAEFKAHLAELMRTDPAWEAAASEAILDKWIGPKGGIRRPKPSKLPAIDENERVVLARFATVRDALGDARRMQARARTQAEHAEADRLFTIAEVAQERAGGNLDTPLRELHDGVWPERETRQ